MAIDWVLPVRGLQVALSITVLGLMSYVSYWWTTHWRRTSPVEINFMIFSPVWSLLVLAPLVLVAFKPPRVLQGFAPQCALAFVEALTMLYWFGGFIALALFLSDRICFGTVCQVAKAGTAMSALNFVAWAATCILGAIRLVRGRGRMPRPNEPKVEMHQGV